MVSHIASASAAVLCLPPNPLVHRQLNHLTAADVAADRAESVDVLAELALITCGDPAA